MLPSNIKIISNYQLYSIPGPVPSQLCFVFPENEWRECSPHSPSPGDSPGTSPTTRPARRRGRRGRRGRRRRWRFDVWLLSWSVSWLLSSSSQSSLGSVWPGGVRQPCDGGGSHTDTQSRIVSTTCPTVQYRPGDIQQPYTVTGETGVTEQITTPAPIN